MIYIHIYIFFIHTYNKQTIKEIYGEFPGLVYGMGKIISEKTFLKCHPKLKK